MKLAEALLLRKQLTQKVEQLKPLKMQGEQGLFEFKSERKSVSDQIDEVTMRLPRITLAEVTKEFDHYATQLRKLDASIQKANWETDVVFTEVPVPKTEPKS